MKGQCSCGEVRYEMTDSPLFVHACHCRNCQRPSGSAHALNAMIETKRVKVLSADIPAAEEYYSADECWPEAALQRRQAVIDDR